MNFFMESFVFAAFILLLVKLLDRGASKYPRPSFQDILTEGKGVNTVKEEVDLVKK